MSIQESSYLFRSSISCQNLPVVVTQVVVALLQVPRLGFRAIKESSADGEPARNFQPWSASTILGFAFHLKENYDTLSLKKVRVRRLLELDWRLVNGVKCGQKLDWQIVHGSSSSGNPDS